MPEVQWRRYLTTNRCRICWERIERRDDWIDCDGWAEHTACHDPEEKTMAALIPVTDLKGTREALCAAQSALADRARRGVDVATVPRWIKQLGDLIREIDVHRPLGSDGKHGDLHTQTCGCDRGEE